MWSSPSLQQLQMFCTVLEEGSMGRAAVRLNVDRSSISRQMRTLQKALRIDLFEITPQGMVPTRAGRIYGREVRSLLHLARRAYDGMLYAAITDLRPFQVGYSPWVNREVLSFLQAVGLPGDDTRPVIPRDDCSARLVNRVLRSELHAAFGVMPIAHEYLKVYPLMTESIGLFLPERHPLALQSRLSARQLRWETVYWVPRRVNPGFYDRITGYLKGVGFDRARFREARGVELALEFIIHGGGITFVPRSAEVLHRSGIVFRPLTDALMNIETCFFLRRDRMHEREIAEFAALVLDTFARVVKPRG